MSNSARRNDAVTALALGLAFALSSVPPAPLAQGPLPAAGKASGPACAAPVTGLPLAGDAGFCTLDSYLAYREHLGTLDRPWFRQVRPGVYQTVGGSPTRVPFVPKLVTRQQLLEEFGFSE